MEPDWDEASEPGSSLEEDVSLEECDAGEAAELGLDTTAPEFYDAEADERDERWVAKQRKGHKSDAVLSCPLCFTTLCLDCQQHERYENQFRAMFVMNCKVLTKQVVRVPQKPARQRWRQQQQQQASEQQGGASSSGTAPSQQLEGQQQSIQQQQQQQQGTEPGAGGEVLHPVQCAACETEVGLRDSDGVFHFFNVFASNS